VADQSQLQRRLCCHGADFAANVPAKQFASVQVNHQRQVGPAVAARPRPTQVSGPAFIWGGDFQGLAAQVVFHALLAFLRPATLRTQAEASHRLEWVRSQRSRPG
jgi:hypothetical protein